MADKAQQKHRTNRVFKSLHKPLTYLGVSCRNTFRAVSQSCRFGIDSLRFSQTTDRATKTLADVGVIASDCHGLQSIRTQPMSHIIVEHCSLFVN
jgi:hypothetical protein